MSTTFDDEAEVENERKEPLLIDEHGEPLKPGRVDTEPRKRPLYRRPAFLIAAVIVLLAIVLLASTSIKDIVSS